MKRSTIAKTFTIAAIAALALSIAPAANAGDKGCSNITLLGTFSRQDTGTIVASPMGTSPWALVGTFTFDGNGNVTGATTSVAFGKNGHGTQTGTYTVNSDCTGTIVVKGSGPNSSHYSFVIDDNVNEFQYICTDSDPSIPLSVVISGAARRQFPIGDWRQ